MSGLEGRGYRPARGERGPIAAYLWPRLNRRLRKRFSIELIHGNSWSGWFENGNPYGDPRPGPKAILRGISVAGVLMSPSVGQAIKTAERFEEAQLRSRRLTLLDSCGD